MKKVVVYLDEKEFKSTWLGNKAVYRTRMAIEDGGELIVIAPGVRKFGEDDENDRLIRKYGYVGRENVLRLCQEHEDLRENLSVAAHLIHGSSDGRFRITYAPGRMTRQEIEGAGFAYADIGEVTKGMIPKCSVTASTQCPAERKSIISAIRHLVSGHAGRDSYMSEECHA